MTTSIETFFSAWGLSDDEERARSIGVSYAGTGTYADPRSDGLLSGPDDITSYVNMFSANAPGWTAQVVATSETAGMVRATVAFGGKGPDGTDMVQHGQYFARTDTDGKITEMVGFVGIGAPE